MHLVKLVVLGAPGVGKTALLEHFLQDSQPIIDATHENAYFVTVVANDTIFQVKIMDMPAIAYFPGNAFSEWTDFRGQALRNAHGYLLVFDLTAPGTFQYLKIIRDQIFESRNMQNVPVYVVGNKADLCSGMFAALRGHGLSHHHIPHYHHHNPSNQLHHYEHHNHDLNPAFKDLAQMVRKQWKSTYIECSAKYNWRVVSVFRELFKAIESNFSQLEALELHLQQVHDQKNHQKDHNGHNEHRESIKSWNLTAQQRAAAPSRTSNQTNASPQRGHHSCHLL